MIGQHYKMPASAEHLAKARPGQYVFLDMVDNEIRGFIDFVSDSEVAVMLFEPTDLPDHVTLISETCDWEARLEEILVEDPQMAVLWERNDDATRSEYETATRH